MLCDRDAPFHGTGSQKAVRRMANQIGKRYVCTKCGAELIVTKGGAGTLSHCGQPMELKK